MIHEAHMGEHDVVDCGPRARPDNFAPWIDADPAPVRALERRGRNRPSASRCALRLRGMQSGSRARLSAAWIAVTASAVPLVAIHACLLISFALGTAEPCFPYVDGGISVSRACRTEPVVHLFRALVLPASAAIACTWWIAAAWLARERIGGLRARRWMLGLGVVGALFLVLYATYLGTQGDVYRLMRRYGVYVFFTGTALAELILTVVLSRARPPALEPWVRRMMVGLCVLMLAAGPLNLAAEKLVERDRAACFFEWWFTLAMVGYPLLLARVWQRGGVGVALDDPR